MAETMRIDSPRGTLMQFDGIRVELKWNSGVSGKWGGEFSKAQQIVDSECLRYCSRLVPFRTGFLEKSGILGTKIGSGEVRYIAPYAHRQYYFTATSRPYDGQRGAKWFERMKAAHRDDILAAAGKGFGH